MSSSWNWNFFDSYEKVEDLLEDLRNKWHHNKPLYVGFLPEHEMYVVAHEPITPEKVLEWWNIHNANYPSEQLTSPPVVEL